MGADGGHMPLSDLRLHLTLFFFLVFFSSGWGRRVTVRAAYSSGYPRTHNSATRTYVKMPLTKLPERKKKEKKKRERDVVLSNKSIEQWA